MKVNRKKNDQKKLLSMPFFMLLTEKNELRQLCIKTSWSTLIQNLFVRGPAVVISWTPWFWSNPSDFQMKLRSECCFIVVSYPRQQKSVRKQKKTWKKCRSKWSLIRLVCAWKCLWSDRPRPKWPLIRPSQNKVASDQASSRPLSRQKCARSLFQPM